MSQHLYKTESHQDKIELLELIYRHKPELLEDTQTWIDRTSVKKYTRFKYLRYDEYDNELTGYIGDDYDTTITREEFLNKIGIREKKNHVINIQFKFT